MENKMKVVSVKYLERFNKGNYEHVDIQFDAVLEDGENATDVLHTLKLNAHNFFYSQTAVPAPQELQKQEPKEEKVKKEKVKKEKVEKSKSEEIADVVEGQEVPPVIPEEKEEMEEVESPFKPTKEEKAKKAKPNISYELANKDHRDRLASYLNKDFPNWKSKPKEDLVAFSKSLDGKEFEDSKGNMLDSFKAEVSRFFK
jgi:hypothetical protein